MTADRAFASIHVSWKSVLVRECAVQTRRAAAATPAAARHGSKISASPRLLSQDWMVGM